MLAFAIFVVTLVLVIWQPKGLGIGWSAMGGALVALVFGVVQLSDVAGRHYMWQGSVMVKGAYCFL